MWYIGRTCESVKRIKVILYAFAASISVVLQPWLCSSICLNILSLLVLHLVICFTHYQWISPPFCRIYIFQYASFLYLFKSNKFQIHLWRVEFEKRGCLEQKSCYLQLQKNCFKKNSIGALCTSVIGIFFPGKFCSETKLTKESCLGLSKSNLHRFWSTLLLVSQIFGMHVYSEECVKFQTCGPHNTLLNLPQV